MTTTVKNIKTVVRRWHILDARTESLGRLASRAAQYLMGKNKVDFTPHVDMGDFVVVTYAAHMKLTGRKLFQKKYFHFSGYPGGIRETAMKDLLATRPEVILREAVRRMLPKNKLRRMQLRRLKIVSEGTHSFKIDSAEI
ncbi:MAG: 50S ribosomal protein L13 [Candidatus Doudnabacteria bacterium RIFCSPHIGHO2_01_FULL_50_11]|uniref:Large ribosomal subunit protein uL13 n=1 Tax=Candidatus Doudnabacteria bacterium RIFCSPHIGHO2_01_FULL_50_11 TaxID=1817828 RepID=A0A1F5PE42_9BACT|nr:MAG: 50S ribosomal protein L13 [Candidatus Doudnabacteria bacterium RIFCSPHIGHO2_01_FULL_50_11]